MPSFSKPVRRAVAEGGHPADSHDLIRNAMLRVLFSRTGKPHMVFA